MELKPYQKQMLGQIGELERIVCDPKRKLSFGQACRQYVHRYTMEHVPDWAKKPCPGTGLYYAPQYRSDRQWYENTLFEGESELATHTHCFSTGQTWPLGKWLNKPYRPRSR